MAEEQRKIEEAQKQIALQQKRLMEIKLLKERQAREQVHLGEKRQRSPPPQEYMKAPVCEPNTASQEQQDQQQRKALSLNDLKKIDLNALLGSVSFKRKRLI